MSSSPGATLNSQKALGSWRRAFESKKRHTCPDLASADLSSHYSPLRFPLCRQRMGAAPQSSPPPSRRGLKKMSSILYIIIIYINKLYNYILKTIDRVSLMKGVGKRSRLGRRAPDTGSASPALQNLLGPTSTSAAGKIRTRFDESKASSTNSRLTCGVGILKRFHAISSAFHAISYIEPLSSPLATQSKWLSILFLGTQDKIPLHLLSPSLWGAPGIHRPPISFILDQFRYKNRSFSYQSWFNFI